MNDRQIDLIIPATQVVTRIQLRDAAGRVIRPPGTVGVIITHRCHACLPRVLPDGGNAALHRGKLSIRKADQCDGLLPDTACTIVGRPFQSGGSYAASADETSVLGIAGYQRSNVGSKSSFNT